MNICEKWPKHYVTDKVSYCFIADSQKSGQGQRSNTWTSPPGNCYVNYLFKMNGNVSIYCAQLASLSVVEVLESYLNKSVKHNKPKLKWINDILIGDKKISGVLPKAEINGSDCYVWIGIGVNINFCPIEGSTCLKEQLESSSDIEVLPFINLLTQKLFENAMNL